MDAFEPSPPVLIAGADLALNHGAVVFLEEGKLVGFTYATVKAGVAKRSKDGHRIELPKTDDPQQLSVWRLQWWDRFISAMVDHSRPKYMGVEDYAFGRPVHKSKEGKISPGHGGHHKGELGGTYRLHAGRGGARLRLHDPASVKMFSAHNGHAQKDEVEAAVRDRWGWDFGGVNEPIKPRQKKQNRESSEDLADAAAVAMLVWTEVRIRRGEITIADLEDRKEMQVFNRCTKSQPISLIGRDWIMPLWTAEAS